MRWDEDLNLGVVCGEAGSRVERVRTQGNWIKVKSKDSASWVQFPHSHHGRRLLTHATKEIKRDAQIKRLILVGKEYLSLLHGGVGGGFWPGVLRVRVMKGRGACWNGSPGIHQESESYWNSFATNIQPKVQKFGNFLINVPPYFIREARFPSWGPYLYERS